VEGRRKRCAEAAEALRLTAQNLSDLVSVTASSRTRPAARTATGGGHGAVARAIGVMLAEMDGKKGVDLRDGRRKKVSGWIKGAARRAAPKKSGPDR